MSQVAADTRRSAEVGALLSMYARMVRIRAFEDVVSRGYRDGEVPGFVHLGIGQEASAVGACWHLEERDAITSTHRGHAHVIAKGVPTRTMLAELLAKETGTCAGRGGSMHVADPEIGVLGANGIVGAGLPIAVGSALGARLRDLDAVTVSFFGDGAVATGAFHEAVNLAAVKRLPVIFWCENNGFAEFSAFETQHPVGVATRAGAYGIESFSLDGNDVTVVAELAGELIRRCRSGDGPFLVDAETYRWHGHYEGDPERYRSSDEVDRWKLRDPLVVAETRLARCGMPEAEIAACRAAVEADVEAEMDDARRDAMPLPSSLHDHVLAWRDAPSSRDVPAAHPDVSRSGDFRYMDAIRDALDDELRDDDRVFLAGIDVGVAGGVFGVTRGLLDRHPRRVIDTPISEAALVGAAVGAAMTGMRPVVEVMYADFIGVCFDQILNQAAKMRFMTGGRAAVPLTIRTQFGAGRSAGSQHSQSLEAMLAHVPGLVVAMPSSPGDAYSLLRASIQDENPVVFIEHRMLYGMKGPRPSQGEWLPMGRAAIRRPGRDVTVVAFSRMVHEALAAAEALSEEGIDVEVIDLRTIVPLDVATVLASLERTARLVIAHEAVRDFGVGAELCALAANEGFWMLDAPVARVGAPRTPAPYAPSLEAAWLPGREQLIATIRHTVTA